MNKDKPISSVIAKYNNYFSSLWREGKPLCLLFSTDEYDYLYDTGTNKILRCDKDVFILLKSIFTSNVDYHDSLYNYFSLVPNNRAKKALITLENCINEKNILKTTKISDFILSENKDLIAHEINNNIGMITLEITQDCNLRCGYCIYRKEFAQKREHTRVYMRGETIRKTVQHLYNNSKEREEVSIGFYGGEPLQRLSQIKNTVDYAKTIFKNKNVRFTITTNGTLLNKNIADYFYKENFSVLLSIDGPREIHDLWRKYKNGSGSFEYTIRGLKIICEAYQKDTKRIGLSMVYAPPFSEEKVEKIASFIDSLQWFPDNVRVNITYPRFMSTPKENMEKIANGIDYSLSKWARRRFMADYLLRKKSHPLANGVMESKLAHLLKRRITDIPIEKVHLNGCCVPGGRKNYISAEGNIKICERIGLAPDIGTVSKGINLEIIYKHYIDAYKKESIRDCSTCWLVGLCSVCYEQAFYDNVINMERKRVACFLTKASMKSSIEDFCTLLENNDKGLDYLKQWELS